jgi:excisionase family DNA binding protein
MQHALSLADVAKLLQVAPSTIYTLMKEPEDKRIPFIRVGKSYRFFSTEISRFFNLDIDIIDKFIANKPTKLTKGVKNV